MAHCFRLHEVLIDIIFDAVCSEIKQKALSIVLKLLRTYDVIVIYRKDATLFFYNNFGKCTTNINNSFTVEFRNELWKKLELKLSPILILLLYPLSVLKAILPGTAGSAGYIAAKDDGSSGDN